MGSFKDLCALMWFYFHKLDGVKSNSFINEVKMGLTAYEQKMTCLLFEQP